MVKEKRATVYAYVGNDRGVAVDFEGNRKRNGWIKLDLELAMDEAIEKLSWRTSDDSPNEVGGWGSNNIVVRKSDIDTLVGQLLTFCDAMFSDKEQKDAWKGLIRKTIHEWHDNKMYRFNLELPIDREKIQ